MSHQPVVSSQCAERQSTRIGSKHWALKTKRISGRANYQLTWTLILAACPRKASLERHLSVRRQRAYLKLFWTTKHQQGSMRCIKILWAACVFSNRSHIPEMVPLKVVYLSCSLWARQWSTLRKVWSMLSSIIENSMQTVAGKKWAGLPRSTRSAVSLIKIVRPHQVPTYTTRHAASRMHHLFRTPQDWSTHCRSMLTTSTKRSEAAINCVRSHNLAKML